MGKADKSRSWCRYGILLLPISSYRGPVNISTRRVRCALPRLRPSQLTLVSMYVCIEMRIAIDLLPHRAYIYGTRNTYPGHRRGGGKRWWEECRWREEVAEALTRDARQDLCLSFSSSMSFGSGRIASTSGLSGVGPLGMLAVD